MAFVADGFGAWLVGLLADAGRRRLTSIVLGTDQERALRQAATAAIQLAVREVRPKNDEQAEMLAMVVNEVFQAPAPEALFAGQMTLLEVLQTGIANQLAALDDPNQTGTGSAAGILLRLSASELAESLTGQLVREIVARGARGGPLEPVAAQLNHDATHLQGQRLEGMLGQVAEQMQDALARLGNAQAVAAAPIILAQLPPTTTAFTGRDAELAALVELLDPASAGGLIVVAGLAGVGKTALVIQAAHTGLRRGWFGGGVLFVDLHGYDDQPVGPAQALDGLLRALGVPDGQIPPTTDERAGLYRSVLAQISEPLLVIADNASAEGQVRPLVPGVPQHKFVVTSRHTLVGLEARLLEVSVLEERASIATLDAVLRAARPGDDRITTDPKAAARLARICGDLPLALQIAGAQLTADPALSVSVLVNELSVEQARLERLQYDDGSTAAVPSVASAFELSYRRLDANAARLFRLLPVNPGPDISTAAAAALANLPTMEVRGILASLARAHLLEPVPGLDGRWQLQELLRLYAQQLSDADADADERDEARARLLRYYMDTAYDLSTRSGSPRYGPEPVGRDFYTTTDTIGYAAYADAIARAIQHKETKPPLTVGIKGAWGAGKTSLMRMVQDRLEWPQGTHSESQEVKRRQIHLTPRARELTYQGQQSNRLGLDGVRNGTVLRALAIEPGPDTEPQVIKAKPNPLPAEDPEVTGWRPTVWFNPWMYQTAEQVWAGLAYEIIKQITDRMSVTEREFFWLRLNLKRVDEQAVRRKIYGIIIDRLVPYAFAMLIFATVGLAFLATDISRWWTVGLAGGAPAAFGLIGIAQSRRVLAAPVSGSMSQLIQPATAGRNLASGTVDGLYQEVVEAPDYVVKSGFFYLVRADVQRVLDLVATGKQPVVVFVDDLDRCSPGTVVQVIEAINLFLAGEYPNAIFVVAMEPEMVAAHIESAYEDLVKAIDNAGMAEARSVTLGWKFLEKVVQLPLTLPALEPDWTMSYFESLFSGTAITPRIAEAVAAEPDVEERIRELSRASLAEAVQMSQRVAEHSPTPSAASAEAQALRQVIDKQLSIDNDEVKKIIVQVAPWLAGNPREMKRFVNVFRFLVMIDSERAFRGMPSVGDPNAIAKLAVLHIRWPDLVATLGKSQAALDYKSVYELLEGQKPAWTDDGQHAVDSIQASLRRCQIVGKIANRITAIDLRMFISSDPKIGAVSKSYL
jgi:hypothetical protein